jgi:hypothetical protein
MGVESVLGPARAVRLSVGLLVDLGIRQTSNRWITEIVRLPDPFDLARLLPQPPPGDHDGYRALGDQVVREGPENDTVNSPISDNRRLVR